MPNGGTSQPQRVMLVLFVMLFLITVPTLVTNDLKPDLSYVQRCGISVFKSIRDQEQLLFWSQLYILALLLKHGCLKLNHKV